MNFFDENDASMPRVSSMQITEVMEEDDEAEEDILQY